jgi:hypothetical protein
MDDYRKGTMKKFNRIVAYGCSVTSGFELADYQLMPNMSSLDVDDFKNKHGIEPWRNLLESKHSLKSIEDAEHKLSWPRWLSEKFNVDFINRAVPGSNSQSSIFFLEKDLNSKIITPNDLIIVGHTEPRRWFWIDDASRTRHCCHGGIPKDWKNQITNRLRWPSNIFYEEFAKYVFNDQHCLYQWYHDIKYLDMLSTVLGGNILQVYCYKTLKQELSEKNDDFFDMMKSANSFQSILDHDYSFDSLVDWNNKDQIHPFTHPKVEYHKVYADHIYNKIIEKNV